MRRTFAFILVMVLAFAITACGKNENKFYMHVDMGGKSVTEEITLYETWQEAYSNPVHLKKDSGYSGQSGNYLFFSYTGEWCLMGIFDLPYNFYDVMEEGRTPWHYFYAAIPWPIGVATSDLMENYYFALVWDD